MNKNPISDRQRAVWSLAALAVPLAKTTSSGSWPGVLLLGSITLVIGWWLARYRREQKPWLEILQGLWASVVVSELLYWSQDCWPGHRDTKAAALIMLALCIWSACKERQRAARVGCMLIWPVGMLLGLILLPALPEIKPANLCPQWQMPDAALVTILLLTTLYREPGKKPGARLPIGLLSFGILVSVITAGVLSPHVSSVTDNGVYELSRSVSFFRSSQRLESLAAVGMTLGYFGTISYLLSLPEKTENRGRMVLAYGVLGGLLYLMDIRLDSRITAIGSILIWAILPSLCGVKKFFQKQTKSA